MTPTHLREVLCDWVLPLPPRSLFTDIGVNLIHVLEVGGNGSQNSVCGCLGDGVQVQIFL